MASHGVAVVERSVGSGRKSTPPTPLATRLRMLRLHGHMGQQDIATYVGPASRVSDWELGIHIPTLRVLQRYADLFGMTVADLLDGVM